MLDFNVKNIGAEEISAVGNLSDADGVTVEAEGVFVQPRWARDRSG